MKKKFFAVALAATMALSSAFTAFAAISGDLEVTTFFNEKTDMVELKSGDSYTFTFHDKNNGTANYNNYVMAITGATGAAYTGADQEVLIVRADNWGWGGKMSDFVAADQASGNKLAFTTNVTDWAAFLADTQAGVDCTVKVSRDGNTIKYDATVGTYTFSLNATSGVALPDSCYVFFTGEKCSLTNFKTVNNNASSTSSDSSAATTAADTTATTAATTTSTVKTGDTTTTAAIVVAMIGAASVALVVRRKKVSE